MEPGPLFNHHSMTRKPNRYAALTAARKSDCSAITPDAVALLDLPQLNQLLRELGERKAPFTVMDLVLDEIRLLQNLHSTPTTTFPLKSTSTRATH